MKPNKPIAHNIHTNTVEPIQGPTIGATTFTTKEYDLLMALLQIEMVIINLSQTLQL